ncbi:hypothetical protein [Aliidiomarina soli]|uniref:Uncharacterized protein n=1 Tax=Aliidiomarina soli TaxID=1928574 RepID=A0A432WEA2_9GAMM|nr:hypothetical protein [Aliidiomarina soli]RUO31138.1 hypothetical protein CWE14_11625 [Aliidiomarina soli]
MFAHIAFTIPDTDERHTALDDTHGCTAEDLGTFAILRYLLSALFTQQLVVDLANSGQGFIQALTAFVLGGVVAAVKR